MPSYRRDRPERSEQPERRGPPEGLRRGPTSFRRELPPGESPFASRPLAPEERTPELWEILVPESERRDPRFDYSKVFDIFGPNPSRSADPQAPRGQAPPPPREAPRQERRREPREINPKILSSIWGQVGTLKRDPRFRPGSPVAVLQVAKPSRNAANQIDEEVRIGDLVRFFPDLGEEVRRYRGAQIWRDVVDPYLEDLAYSLNYQKPREFPGRLLFQEGRDASFWLAYTE